MESGRGRQRFVWVAALALAGAVAWFLWPRQGSGLDATIAPPTESPSRSSVPLDSAGGDSARVEAVVDESQPVASGVSEEAQIGGTVRDTRGQPVAGAWVNVSFEAAYLIGPIGCRSDREGRWVVEHRKPGAQLLEVEGRARGFVAARVRPRLRLVPGMNGGIDVVLTAAPGFAGRVLDARTGQPIEGAAASVSNAPDWTETLARSDADGRFQLAGGRSQEVDVIVSRNGYAYDRSWWKSQDAEHIVHLEPADALVSGVLLWPDGTAAADQTVHIGSENGRFSFLVTDEEGRFRFKAFGPGHARVFAFGEGRGSARTCCLLREVDLQPGENELRLQLELPPEAHLLLRVTSSGAPAAHTRVVVTQEAPAPFSSGGLDTRWHYTDDAGRLDLGGFLPIHCRVHVEGPGGLLGSPSERELDLKAGEAAGPLEFELVSGVRFAGRVGALFPAGALSVELWAAEAQSPLARAEIRDRSQGFGLGPVPPARYRLRLLDRGEIVAEIDVGPNSESAIRLEPAR